MTIFIQAYRSFSMRYIIGTDIFKTLISSNCQIIIFVLEEDFQYFTDIFKNTSVIVESVHYKELFSDLRKNRITNFLNLLRVLTSGRQSTLINTNISIYKRDYKKQFSYGFGIYIYKLITISSFITCNSILARKVLSFLLSISFKGKIYDKYFEKYNPKTLIISSLGYGIDLHMMHAAKRHKCRIISIPHSWDNPTTKGYRGPKPDLVFAWTNRMATEIAAFHDLPKNIIKVSGVAHWDDYFNGTLILNNKDSFIIKHNLDPNKKVLFYALSGPANFEKRLEVIEAILGIIKNNPSNYNLQLLVRFHPLHVHRHTTGATWMELHENDISALKMKYGNLVTFWVPKEPHKNQISQLGMSDMHDMASAIHYSDVLIQEYSTLILESTIFDKPTINISMFAYRQTDHSNLLATLIHLQYILKYDTSTTIQTFEELKTTIFKYLDNPEIKQNERRKLFNNELNINPGSAGNFIGNSILKYMDDLVVQGSSSQ